MAFPPASILSLPKSPYETCVEKLSAFAIPYFIEAEVVKNTIKTNSFFGFNANNIRVPSTANHFHPNIWDGYQFGSSTTNSYFQTFMKLFYLNNDNKRMHQEPDTYPTRLEEKKNEVKTILSLASNDSFQELDLVDKIQRLGLAYQFQVEIRDILNRTYDDDYTYSHSKSIDGDYADLHFVTLRFRLLRQAGYYVSPAIFSKFRDESGEFSIKLVLDVQGMLSLYEASHLGFNGEDIMDDAMTFTTNHLQSMSGDPTSLLTTQIKHALQTPLHQRVERVLAMEYMKIYGEDITRNATLLEYAKLDFNFVQLLHQKEINELSRWWKQININSKVPFKVRDRVVEAYAIINGFNFEPEFSLGRIHLTKIWCVLTILDDVHDVYGNITELEPLCDALQRWDDADLSDLPNHMKEIFHVMLNLFNDIDGDLRKKGHVVGGPYLKKELQVLAKGYFEEAKILVSRDLPTIEKWTQLSLVTIAPNPFIVAAAMNMGENATKEIFDWIDKMPRIIKCTYLIARILDDIGTYKVERERGIITTSVTCYMKEHGVSESEAIKSLRAMCVRLWKDMNQECLRINNPVPLGLHKVILNFTRILGVYYVGGDGYTNSKGSTKETITSMLVNPIQIE